MKLSMQEIAERLLLDIMGIHCRNQERMKKGKHVPVVVELVEVSDVVEGPEVKADTNEYQLGHANP